jgi:NO-binding membrane sensor protein with MHYT domain
MVQINHFSYGLVTPVLAYALSVLGALLGLTCTVRARQADTAARRAWFLLLAAWAIGGTGIWVMHFIAMLGFGVPGSEIRYDVPITTVSAVIAIVVVGVGLFTAGFGRPHPVKIILGGTFAGLGVASMHYTGMAAMRINGTVVYDDRLVAASIAIAVVAATVALWFTVAVRKPIAIVASALVMGVAVSGMHYTGMSAMEVHLHDTGGPLTGSTVFALILPIVLLVIFVLVGLVYAVLAAPTAEDRAGAAYLDQRIASRQQAAVQPAPGSLAGFGGLGSTGPPGQPSAGGKAGSGGAAGGPGDPQRVNGRPGPEPTGRQTVPRTRRTRRS